MLSVILFRLPGSRISLEAEPTPGNMELQVAAFITSPEWMDNVAEAVLDLQKILQVTNPSTRKEKMRTDHVISLLTKAHRCLGMLKTSIPESAFAQMREHLVEVLRVQSQSNPGEVEALVRDVTRALTQMLPSHQLFPVMSSRL